MQFPTSGATIPLKEVFHVKMFMKPKTDDVGSLFRKFDEKALWEVNLY